jgi:uncharacterized membrane protein SpoIIM required for sporulation
MLANYFLLKLPQDIHRDRTLLLFALAVFMLALSLSFFLVRWRQDVVYIFYHAHQLSELARVYDPAFVLLQPPAMPDIWHDGIFYFTNNCLVGLQLLVAGSLFGVGTLILLLYSATSLGVLMGYIHFSGNGAQMWPSIIGHSSLELLATVLFAVAGFRLGLWLLQCWQCRCLLDTRLTLHRLLHLLLPATALYGMAALVEAGWSHNPLIAGWARYGVGALLWCAMVGYLYFALRRGRAMAV